MTFRDRWLRRTDGARRIKGDPPPTVDELLVTVRFQGEVIRDLKTEIGRLRTVVAEKTEYAEDLALELTQATRLDPDPARAYIKKPEATT